MLVSKFEKVEQKLSSFDEKVTKMLSVIDKKVMQNNTGNEILQRELADTKEEIRLLKKHCKQNAEKVAPELSESNLPQLPLKSLDDLTEMEELLSSSQEEKVNFIRILKDCGGIHARSVVNCMMRTCLRGPTPFFNQFWS